MKEILITIITSFILTTTISAQVHNKAARIEAKKIAFISRTLDLTPEEAKVFWPVYNEHEAKTQAIEEQYKLDQKPLEMSDQELEQFIDNTLIKESLLLDEKKSYVSKLKKVISIKKIALLYKTERKFRRKVIKEVRKRMKKQKHKNK